MPAADALVLFDVDGTLIRPQSGTQGMLDRDILTVMLRNAGASRAVIREKMPEIVRHAQNIYARSCPNLEDKGLSGSPNAASTAEPACCSGRIGHRKSDAHRMEENGACRSEGILSIRRFRFQPCGPGSASLCNVRGAKA